jgi:hypothetical protein
MNRLNEATPMMSGHEIYEILDDISRYGFVVLSSIPQQTRVTLPGLLEQGLITEQSTDSAVFLCVTGAGFEFMREQSRESGA